MGSVPTSYNEINNSLMKIGKFMKFEWIDLHKELKSIKKYISVKTLPDILKKLDNIELILREY